jgi:hypothetical protein
MFVGPKNLKFYWFDKFTLGTEKRVQRVSCSQYHVISHDNFAARPIEAPAALKFIIFNTNTF